MGAVEWFSRWWRTLVLAGAAAAVVGWLAPDGYAFAGVLAGAGLLGAGVFLAPLRAPRSISHADAQQRARAEGLLVAYWRPGCESCERLRSGLRGESGVLWVDIWQDPAAATFVREMNDGYEVVPTVIAGAAVWPAPGTEKVRAALRTAPTR
ncbi:hypothetical protein [Georgenia sunbinii]|uniref:hypothetical protein n=1 Tax=Georgenia sunbinii TaxID=3117728 RepID=UPI002F2644C0